MRDRGTARRAALVSAWESLEAGVRRLATMLTLFALLLPLAACSNFFQCEKASCPTTGGSGNGSGSNPTPVTTGDYAYVANSSAGSTYLSEYSISSNTLNPLSTLQLGYTPVALAVSPSNSFLYVASVTGIASPGIYLYTIGSTGTLSVANGGNVLYTDTVSAMAISPDGKWLFTVNIDGSTMAEYPVNTSDGSLGAPATVSLLDTPCTPTLAVPVSQSCSVTVAQSGNYVVVSLGTSGDLVYPYNSTNGITSNTVNSVLSIPSGYPATPTGNFSAAVNIDNYAYIAQTNSVAAYVLQATSIPYLGTASYTTGSAPRSIVLNPAGSLVFTANELASTISAFTVVSGGGLTTVSGSPTPGPTNVSAISVDNTGGYLMAVGYDASAGVRLYSISTTGVLSQVAQAGSGTNEAFPALIAMTH